MSHTYEELKHKTVAELREIAKGIEHDAVQGATQMNKDHLLKALCTALGLDMHVQGSFSLGNTVFDIGVMIFFGIVGFLMKKFGYESAPLVLAFILGPMFEDHFRRSLVLSFGSFGIFFERPISAAFLGVAVLLLLISVLPVIRKRKQKTL